MKVVRYFFVGAISALVDLSLYTFYAINLDYNYLLVAAFSFIFATFVNYFVSVRLVFQSGTRFSKRHEITAVFVASTVGLVINLSILYLLVDSFAMNSFLSKIAATVFVFVWNYSIRAYYIFSDNPSNKNNDGIVV